MQFEGGKWPGERRLRLYRTRGEGGYAGFFFVDVIRGWDFEEALSFFSHEWLGPASSGYLFDDVGPRGGSEVEYLYLFIRALSVRHLDYFAYSYRGVGEERWRKLRIRADKV